MLVMNDLYRHTSRASRTDSSDPIRRALPFLPFACVPVVLGITKLAPGHARRPLLMGTAGTFGIISVFMYFSGVDGEDGPIRIG